MEKHGRTLELKNMYHERVLNAGGYEWFKHCYYSSKYGGRGKIQNTFPKKRAEIF